LTKDRPQAPSRTAALLSCAVALSASASFGAAWPVGEGKGQTFVSLFHGEAETESDDFGCGPRETVYRKNELDVYAEYGPAADVTIGTQQLFQHAERRRDCSGVSASFDMLQADVWKEQRYFVRKTVFDPASKNVIGAVQADIFLPGVDMSDATALTGGKRYGYGVKGLYGKRRRSIRLRFCKGCEEHAVSRFFHVEAGVSHELQDGRLRALVEITEGYGWKEYFVWAQASGSYAMNGFGTADAAEGGDYDLVTETLTVGRHLSDRVSVAVGVSVDSAARSAPRGTGVRVMAWRRF
jgi:hypothetical protein